MQFQINISSPMKKFSLIKFFQYMLFRKISLIIGCILYFLCFLNFAKGQIQGSEPNSDISIEVAHKFFISGKYPDAYIIYKKISDSDTKNWEATFYQALCLYGGEYYLDALDILNEVEKRNPKHGLPISFYKAECLFNLGKYKECIPLYEKFAKASYSNEAFVEKSRTNIKNAKFALSFTPPLNKSDLTLIVFPIPSTISSKLNVGNPNIDLENKLLYFTQSTPEASECHIYVAPLDTQTFLISGTPTSVFPENTKYRDKEFCLSYDGKTMYIGRHPRDISQSNDCGIFISHKNQNTGKWSEPIILPQEINSSLSCESWPCISPNGKILYFSSDRIGGFGGYDIWYSEKVNDKWLPAKNLGPTINTPGDEFDPHIEFFKYTTPDKILSDSTAVTLYFSSTFHDGFGGADIFSSEKKNSIWLKPQNMGIAINTPWDDFDYFRTQENSRRIEISVKKNRKKESQKFEYYPILEDIILNLIRLK